MWEENVGTTIPSLLHSGVEVVSNPVNWATLSD